LPSTVQSWPLLGCRLDSKRQDRAWPSSVTRIVTRSHHAAVEVRVAGAVAEARAEADARAKAVIARNTG
jgi:hypothetical protein